MMSETDAPSEVPRDDPNSAKDQTPATASRPDSIASDVPVGSSSVGDARVDDEEDSTTGDVESEAPKRAAQRIKIGSQRDESANNKEAAPNIAVATNVSDNATNSSTDTVNVDASESESTSEEKPAAVKLAPETTAAAAHDPESKSDAPAKRAMARAPQSEPTGYPPPNLRDRLSPDLEEEFEAALASGRLKEEIARLRSR